MNKNVIFSCLFGALLFASGCDQFSNIDVEAPAFESELVLEAYFEPGRNPRIVVRETYDVWGRFNAPATEVSGATVSLSRTDQSGNTIDISEVTAGLYYGFDYKFGNEGDFLLTASHENRQVSAKITMLSDTTRPQLIGQYLSTTDSLVVGAQDLTYRYHLMSWDVILPSSEHERYFVILPKTLNWDKNATPTSEIVFKTLPASSDIVRINYTKRFGFFKFNEDTPDPYVGIPQNQMMLVAEVDSLYFEHLNTLDNEQNLIHPSNVVGGYGIVASVVRDSLETQIVLPDDLVINP